MCQVRGAAAARAPKPRLGTHPVSLCLMRVTQPAQIQREGKPISLLVGRRGKITWPKDMYTEMGGILTALFVKSLPQ